MKKILFVLATASLFVLMGTQATAGSPWKVSVWQAGVCVSEVQAGTEFQISGEGFHNSVHPVKVCLFDNQCQLAEPDRAGNFTVNRTVSGAGSYEIRVFQAQNPNITGWRMKAMTPVTVTN